jgi:hypothetical protein
MSFSASNLGTNQQTYAYNRDRSGEWANYLLQLSRSANHDRQTANGELNAVTGVVNEPIDLKHSQVKSSYTKVTGGAKGWNQEKVRKLKKVGYNPRYDENGIP